MYVDVYVCLQKTSNGSYTEDYGAVRYFGALFERLKIVAKELQDVLPQDVTTRLYDAANNLKVKIS